MSRFSDLYCECWEHPQDPDAKITKMKDGSTHLAHKAERAVDLETGAIIAVTEASESGRTGGSAAGKGDHSNAVLRNLSESGVRSYIPEPERGERNWKGKAAEKKAVCGNRRRGEYIERSFSHMYETGAMRRTHLRGRDNLRILVFRSLYKVGTGAQRHCFQRYLRLVSGLDGHGESLVEFTDPAKRSSRRQVLFRM